MISNNTQFLKVKVILHSWYHPHNYHPHPHDIDNMQVWHQQQREYVEGRACTIDRSPSPGACDQDYDHEMTIWWCGSWARRWLHHMFSSLVTIIIVAMTVTVTVAIYLNHNKANDDVNDCIVFPVAQWEPPSRPACQETNAEDGQVKPFPYW